MRRETTNIIRFMMDELLPPFIRDAYWFMYPFFFIVYRGKDIKRKMHFKSLVYSMSQEAYNDFYNEIDVISGKRNTDLTESNIRFILEHITPASANIIDIGCGKGYLLSRIKKTFPAIKLYGSDMSNNLQFEGITFLDGYINKLPFKDEEFDTVICTHTIEHIVELQAAINELLRITKKQLIIVTPCQRYFYYTLDGHINFFYSESELLRYLPFKKFICRKINMDWVYIGYKDETLV